MRRTYLLIACFLVSACACGRRGDAPPTGGGEGAGCAAIEPHVRALYRAEASRAEPTRIDAATDDNTAMALGFCRRTPSFAPCAKAATTVADLEAKCLPQLDDEGAEGDQFRAAP